MTDGTVLPPAPAPRDPMVAATPDTEVVPTPPDPLVSETPPPTGSAPVRLTGWPGVPLTSVSWGWRAALGLAFLALFTNAAIASLARLPSVQRLLRAGIASLPSADRGWGLWAGVLVVSVVTYAVLLAAALVSIRRKGAGIAPALGFRPVRLWPSVGLVVAGVWIGFSVDIVYSISTAVLKLRVPNTNAEMLRAGTKSPFGLIAVFLLVAVIAPVAEEILFRGVVFSGLRDSWGEGWAIAASSVLFGVMHLEPVLMIPTAILGVLLAKVFSMTRSLWVPIALHSAYNATIMGFGLLALRATGKL